MRDFRPVSKWRKMTSTITMVALCAIIGLAMMVIIVEWLVGCGEKEYSSDGSYDVIDCVFFDNNPTPEGTWR